MVACKQRSLAGRHEVAVLLTRKFPANRLQPSRHPLRISKCKRRFIRMNELFTAPASCPPDLWMPHPQMFRTPRPVASRKRDYGKRIPSNLIERNVCSELLLSSRSFDTSFCHCECSVRHLPPEMGAEFLCARTPVQASDRWPKVTAESTRDRISGRQPCRRRTFAPWKSQRQYRSVDQSSRDG